MLQYFVIMCAVGVGLVSGHGRMMQPPSRASMFRYGYNTPTNYNDNELNCGGFAVQQQLGGKCGICGDPYNAPRDHEAGGRYANGIITGSYVSGQVIRVVIEITANHRGYFVFKACPNNNVNRAATQECLDEYALELADGSGPKYYIDTRVRKCEIDLKLPDGLVCSQCVLQWMYRCGNNHGTAENGTSCLGCGPQEEFYACSDIRIMSNGGQPFSQTPVAVDQTPAAVSQTTSDDDQATVAVNQTPATVSQTSTDDDQTPETTNQNDQKQAPTEDPTKGLPPMNKNCYATGIFGTIGPRADMWCKYNCFRGFCPESMCQCPDDDPPSVSCVANGSYQGNADTDIWCRTNCGLGFCPSSHCLCIPV